MSWLRPDAEDRARVAALRGTDAAPPALYRLAAALAPALRVEPLLLRNARLERVPDSDAGLEAELWFSELVASRSASRVVLHPGAARLLCDRLAQELGDAGFRRHLAFVATHTRHWSELDGLEQRLRLAARDDDAAAVRTGLESVLARLAAETDPRARRDLARWARGVLPHVALRDDPAQPPVEPARWLQQYSAAALGDAGGVATPAGEAAAPMPAWLAAELPPPSRRPSGLTVELRAGELHCPRMGEGGHLLDLSTPLPAPVRLSFEPPGSAAPRAVVLAPGVRVPLPAGCTAVIIEAAGGGRWRLRALEGSAGAHGATEAQQRAASPESAAGSALLLHAPEDARLAQQVADLLDGIGVRVERRADPGPDGDAPHPVSGEGRPLLRLWSEAAAKRYGSIPGSATHSPALLLRADQAPPPPGSGSSPVIDLARWDGDPAAEEARRLLAAMSGAVEGVGSGKSEAAARTVQQAPEPEPPPTRSGDTTSTGAPGAPTAETPEKAEAAAPEPRRGDPVYLLSSATEGPVDDEMRWLGENLPLLGYRCWPPFRPPGVRDPHPAMLADREARREALERSGAVLYLARPDAQPDEMAQSELARAVDVGLPVLPVVRPAGPRFLRRLGLGRRPGLSKHGVPASLIDVEPFTVDPETKDPDALRDALDEALRALGLTPDPGVLLEVLDDPDTGPPTRLAIGDRLAALGDPRPGVGLRDDGVPDIDWVEVPAGPFVYQDGETREFPAFRIARYPVTNAQFQAFVDDGGYAAERWWEGLEKRLESPRSPHWPQPNRPRERVSWFEALAFCRWLSLRLGLEVRLPVEQEWEKAARGNEGLEYPWGDEYRSGYANVQERGGKEKEGAWYLGQTSAVGMYPQGASPYGVLDLSGNVWEWCLNVLTEPKARPDVVDLGSAAVRVLRGGSWDGGPGDARASGRGGNGPDFRYVDIGFRVLCASPVPS